jgi:hypothetical protein
MKQNKRVSRRLTVFLSIIAMFAVAGVAMYLNVQSSDANVLHGRITVAGPFAAEGTGAAMLELQSNITIASGLFSETVAANSGAGLSPSTWWAPAAARTTFNTAITTATNYLNSISFAAGQEFDISVSIADNAGFAGMMLALNLPPQLQLVGITNHAHNIFDSPHWDGTFTVSPPRTGNNLVAGWGPQMSGNNVLNYSVNGQLLTYRVRVVTGAAAGATNPIGITFANSHPPHQELPANAAGDYLNISVNGGNALTAGQLVDLGRILIRN